MIHGQSRLQAKPNNLVTEPSSARYLALKAYAAAGYAHSKTAGTARVPCPALCSMLTVSVYNGGVFVGR